MVNDLLRGIVVIIDDEVYEAKSEPCEIKNIINNFKEKNIPLVLYDNIPDKETIKSISSSSAIILDWEYKTVEQKENSIKLGDELRKIKIEKNIEYIEGLIKEIFVPIYIFTYQGLKMVKEILEENGLGKYIDKRIFIQNKNELEGEKLYSEIQNWVIKNPAVYVAKVWDNIAQENRNKMFLDLYNSEADWVPILWEALKDDSSNGINASNELGEFITRVFLNRFCDFEFDNNILESNSANTKDIFKVLRHDVFIDYKDNPPRIPYTGDLYLGEDGKYYLNIRAQCDICREKNENREYNPQLYCLVGQACKDTSNVISKYAELKKEEGKLHVQIGNKLFEVGDNLEDINKEIHRCINEKFLYTRGALLERQDIVLLPYIVENRTLRFGMDKIEVINFNDSDKIKKQLGRIVPPYLTRIQQKAAHYIIRQGIMPIPEEVYFN